MRLMHFPQKFIEWVKMAMATTKFSLNMNGALVGYFNNERGLRQGDTCPFMSFC